MKKKISVLVIAIILSFSLFACGSKFDGTYYQYEIKDEMTVIYFSMRLKNGNYRLDDVKNIAGKKTIVSISKGTFSIKGGEITFKEKNGASFKGVIVGNTLTFSCYSKEYLMKK